MSNHAAVTADGGEVGRAQAMQALAAGIPLDRRMNPVLLKPTRANNSHLVVLGDEVARTDAHGYGPASQTLKPVVLQAFTSLRQDYDWVVAEGAGGAAEINLLDRDLVNLPLARAAGMKAVLVVDIDRGGAFAAAHGTIDLLPESLRSSVAGVIFNQFRGDASLLDDGNVELERRSGVPVLGVLPHLGEEPMLGVEDSLDITLGAHSISRSPKPVRVAAIRLPHLANPSDLDPFVVEPDVEVRWVTRPDELTTADLVVIPGSRSTVSDLDWLRERGLDLALAETDAWVVGVCAGYQMLGHQIHDRVESDRGTVSGLGLLDVETTFEQPKIVRRSEGVHADGSGNPVHGYQIRFGRPSADAAPLFRIDGDDEGAQNSDGTVLGSSLHGLFDADGFRNSLLSAAAEAHGRTYEPAPVSYLAALDRHHEDLADWLETHVDTQHLLDLAATAPDPAQAPGW